VKALTVAGAVLALASLAAAQAPQEPVAPTGTAPAVPDYFSAGTDSLIVVVPYRAQDEIRRDLEQAMAGQAQAVNEMERAKLIEAHAETRIKIKEVELQGIGAQLDLAKHEKNEMRKAEFEGRKKVAEAEKQLLEKRRDLRRREIDIAKARKEFFEAQGKSFQLEAELGVKREARASMTSALLSGTGQEQFIKATQEIDKLTKKVLDAQIETADKYKKQADLEVQIVKIRKQIYESQVKAGKVER
jgi:hypothetical protein